MATQRFGNEEDSMELAKSAQSESRMVKIEALVEVPNVVENPAEVLDQSMAGRGWSVLYVTARAEPAQVVLGTINE
jgi:hypothetical protein